jgi:hypothetical protein
MNWWRFADLALIVVVFVAVGPLVGMLATVPMSLVGLLFSRWIEFATHFPAFMLLYGWVFAHFVGWAPAALTGVLVALYAWRCRRVPLAVGAVAGLASSMILSRWAPFDLKAEQVPIVVIWVATHVVAAIACTRLTRRWQ